MKADDLFNRINDIDDDLIREASNARQSPGTRICRMLCTAAAVLVLTAGLTILIFSSDPKDTLKDKHNTTVIIDNQTEGTTDRETTSVITRQQNSSATQETTVSTTTADTSNPRYEEPHTAAAATESTAAYEPDTNAPPENIIPSDTDKDFVGTDDFGGNIHKEDFSGIPLDKWLNDTSVIWAENDPQDIKDASAASPGTAVISPELRELMEKYPEEGTVFAVTANFSPSDSEPAENNPGAYYSEKLRDFQETFRRNGLEIYPCENSDTFFYTFGTAIHFEEFVCGQNEEFIFRPAGDFR